MKKQLLLGLCLYTLTTIALADAASWGDVGGGSLDAAPAKPAQTAAAPEPACGGDDPRIKNIVPTLKEVKAGQPIKPVQMRFGTYMSLSSKVRKLLGDNIAIVTQQCKTYPLFEGELTNKVQMSFVEISPLINDTLRTNDENKLRFIFANIQAAPDSLNNIINYSKALAYPLASGKLLAKVANIKPVGIDKKGKQMGISNLSLYAAMGGTLAAGQANRVILYRVQSNTVISIVFNPNGYGVDVGRWHTYISYSYVSEMSERRMMNLFTAVGVIAEPSDKRPSTD